MFFDIEHLMRICLLIIFFVCMDGVVINIIWFGGIVDNFFSVCCWVDCEVLCCCFSTLCGVSYNFNPS